MEQVLNGLPLVLLGPRFTGIAFQPGSKTFLCYDVTENGGGFILKPPHFSTFIFYLGFAILLFFKKLQGCVQFCCIVSDGQPNPCF